MALLYIRPSFRPERLVSAALLALLVNACPTLWAQSGDRPNDPQQPPPHHWVIPPAPALSVEDALKTFKVAPGYRIEVVAAEPLVFDPVVMQIGPDGRMWVVEMRGYMPNVDGIGEDQPIGTIAVLTDTDGDGRMDKRSEFASGLVMPRALLLVGDGVLVAAPPMLWHFRDTDGDEIADAKTVVSESYGDDHNPEHTANSLTWGNDNWIYSANYNVRFRYRNGTWESSVEPNRGQWGLTQDDRGRLYYNTNSNPLRGDLFPGHYRLRNPDLVGEQSTNYEIAPSKNIRVFPGRITPGVNRGYKILDDEGYLREVTAACAPLVYRSNLFPSDAYGNIFVAEPSGNLIKRLSLEEQPDGSVVGRNTYADSEFLTSTDERFRPVNLQHGPDGALYVVDMYRGIIQHRIFVTTFLRNQILDRGLEQPIGMGRIYRIVPDNHPTATPLPTLDPANPAELIAALSHSDAWQRETAQRLLIERADASIALALRPLINTQTGPGRINALWTLEGLNALDEKTLLVALKSRSLDDVDLIINALQAAEPFLAQNSTAIIDAVTAAALHVSPAVRRQVALSISFAPTPKAVEVLGFIAGRDDGDDGMPEAIVSGLRGHELALIDRLTTYDKLARTRRTATVAAATIIARSDVAEIKSLLAYFDNAAPDSDLAAIIIDGFQRNSSGKKANRQRIKLPVEPTALAAFVAKTKAANNSKISELEELLSLIDGPEAQSKVAVATPLTPTEQLQFDQGKVTFALCAGCHQPDGRGQQGLAPALVGSKWATGNPALAAAIVLKGKEGNGLVMPPLEALDDNSLANALTYIRRSWGHTASAVSPETIAAARKTHSERSAPWTDADLEAISEK
jgi:mono/diheme cytochrome c family protein/glucose/arabinose dehydrogenase